MIIEGGDENRDPIRIRQAIEELLTTYQDYPLLLLVTCRDTVRSSLRSPTIKASMPERGDVSLGLYNDNEFKQAQKKYYARWNVHAELSIEAKKALRSPLLLSIFTEVNQDRLLKFVPTVVAKELWEKYLEKKIENIHEALEVKISQRAIRTGIEQLALQMLDCNNSSLSFFLIFRI